MTTPDIVTEIEQVRSRAAQRQEEIETELAPLQSRIRVLMGEAERIRSAMGSPRHYKPRKKTRVRAKNVTRSMAILTLLKDQERITTGSVVDAFLKTPELMGGMANRTYLQCSVSHLLSQMVGEGRIHRIRAGLYSLPLG